MYIDFNYYTEPNSEVKQIVSTEAIDKKHPIFLGIGLAEGTRFIDGSFTPASYYHIDPGNKAINIGTCSYQHLSSNYLSQLVEYSNKVEGSKDLGLVAIADSLCLKTLNKYKSLLIIEAEEKGLFLDIYQLANGIDLANQSPQAALNNWGYIDRLKQKLDSGLKGKEAIIEARTWSYWSPNINKWDAPGLGNTYPLIRRDQKRRTLSVIRALE
jgi:hypothetical protein